MRTPAIAMPAIADGASSCAPPVLGLFGPLEATSFALRVGVEEVGSDAEAGGDVDA